MSSISTKLIKAMYWVATVVVVASRPHCYEWCKMEPIATDVAWSVCVCWSRL